MNTTSVERDENLAVGVVTAPRSRPTLERTLAALRRAGFVGTIDVFAEPDSLEPTSPDVRWHPNGVRRGLWGNWLHCARSLLASASNALLMICEDDVLFARGATRALRTARERLAHEDWGYASLYTPWRNVGDRIPRVGWQPVETAPPVWGALAYVFTRDSLQAILDSSAVRGHRGADGTDDVVNRAVLEVGRRAYHHVPSLVDHADDGYSTSGHVHGPLAEGVAFDATYVPGPASPPAPRGLTRRSSPLVSCTMVTGGRRDFALRSIDCFRRQTYPNRELVIVDDGRDGLGELVREDDRIRHHPVPAGHSIGWKRNLANGLARGDLVATWDDDDWHGERRLERQAEPILRGRTDVTALRGTVFFDLQRWSFWRCSAELHRRMFVEDVHGGTLVYRRQLAEDVRFPDTSLAEDASFLRAVVARGARLERLPAEDDYVYLRHGGNTWSFPLGGHDWVRERHPRMPDDDLLFYVRRHRMSRLRRELGTTPPVRRPSKR